MKIFRLVLFLGLVFHKLVWEVLKARDSKPKVSQQPSNSPLKSLVKLLKGAVLIFLIVQTLFLNLFPIAKQPTRLRIIGIAIFFAGLATAVVGRFQLGENRANIEDYQILPEQSLVTKGIYRYIRHPIYTGDMLLLVGLELALNSWLVLGTFGPLLVIFRQALAEESMLSQMFPDYDTYRRQTKRFIPFIL